MQEACKVCCTVPKEVIKKVLRGIEITESIIGKSNKSAESDLVVGKNLLEAAKKGAWENIAINLKYINDEEFVKEYKEWGRKYVSSTI
jgi:formiminotetrahydrofolate cyclodeaminase